VGSTVDPGLSPGHHVTTWSHFRRYSARIRSLRALPAGHTYLKTYDGEGSATVLLADWTSLHLDLLARDRGLKRMAASLYEVTLGVRSCISTSGTCWNTRS